MAKTPQKEKTPTIFIIFGGTGDLTKRKIMPALYNLFIEGWLPNNFVVIGSSSSDINRDAYAELMRTSIDKYSRNGKAKKEDWENFVAHLQFQLADITQSKSFEAFHGYIEKYEKEWGQKPIVIYYCAVAPRFFSHIAENIEKSGLENHPDIARIIIEKPFGRDRQSAVDLNSKLLSNFDECQIYRIDHYLGKEVVQNIMAFRFANMIMEPIWNRNHIEHVQISVTEQLGIEDRGKYFDNAGVLRDMIQNHLLQLFCIVAMEPPINLDADEVRDRKVDVLKAMRKIQPGKVEGMSARGQYSGGWMKGKEVPGYREEKNVGPNSNTETYAALKLYIDNWRWQGVPFYLRTGKRLFQTSSIITIQFKEVPHNIFIGEESGAPKKNRLIISIQPDMGIRFQLQNKMPGIEMLLDTVDVVFDYAGEESDAPEAYETLLIDAMSGDQSLFMRADQVEEAWRVITPILEYWDKNKNANFPNYPANSWGPENAEALIARDGFHWFNLPG